MRKHLDAAQTPAMDDIRRAAALSVHTYDGAIADEWREQAEALREGEGGDESANADAGLSQRIADVLRELDEKVASKGSDGKEGSPARHHPVALATLWVTLEEVRRQLDDVTIPLGTHLSLQDPELMAAMEDLSAKINAHFKMFRLAAKRRRRQKN